jgi:glycosyltransferase involved in cell wall biosynthesis
VLAARSGGLPSLIRGNADLWLSPPGDSAALANRLERILKDGRDALPGPDTFADVVARTTPDAIADQYLSFYAQVRASHSS